MSASSHPLHYWDNVLKPIRERLLVPQARARITGAHGAMPAFALSVLTRASERSSLVIAASDEAAQRFSDDLLFFQTLFGFPSDAVQLFPEWETLPYEPTAPPPELIARRMRALLRLTEGARTVLVTSVPAVLQRLMPADVFRGGGLKFKAGQTVEREALIARLLRLGYRRGSVVEIPGEFSVRGGIVDIFSTAYDEPLRVELLGDTIESIRRFDPATQKSTDTLSAAWLLPAREVVYPEEDPRALEPLPPDAEWRSPNVYDAMETLLEYFRHPPIIVLDQPDALSGKAQEFLDEAADAYLRSDRSEAGEYAAPDALYLTWEELRRRLEDRSWLAFEPLGGGDAGWQPTVAFPAHAPSSVGLAQRGTPFTETLQRLNELRQAGPVVVVARSRGQVDRLLALFGEQDLPAERWKPQDLAVSTQKPPFSVVQGELSAGFVAPEARFAIVTEEELFAKGMRHRPAAKSRTATFLSSLEDLNAGDFVVHVQHGIARYEGLKRLAVQGFESDYLILRFAGGDTLYVPLDRLNQVQRYKGAEGHAPKLDKLGGTSWERTTARVKKSIEEMAHELVELYASREVVQRHEYGHDTPLTHAFEAAFEYEETPDQIRAIEDIKRDLAAAKPMDRIVCGDVGYGKTEVAMRAAFKAVEHNRQVAVLVPTTLLAQQHYDNFSQRFGPFPIKVGLLSRFQTPKEAKAVLAGLADGSIDIVIGTHRLLQKGVVFRNLGLVVIDEEQWFGVRHKERLKQLRTQVDVLTLTATPIPRTLQMAMSGLRDLSVIETPPPGRLAIRTHVMKFSEETVREAIVRELGRGGQVYFVHNRVQTMERTATWLQHLVPEARIVMAHGQMDERVLEGVMLKFLKREADVLVTSAIIQSGLDVANANTILVNRADTFGLSQLYQLRGRVGRSGQQAYAYFFTPDEGTLTTDAQKRLLAIQEFTELGAGFRIAAADLEIRGAGNFLGKQQSGHIAAVGLDLYLQMVEQAVQQIKGTVVEEEPDPTLHLNVSAFIPDTYVTDSHQRLSLYKRLTSSTQMGDLALLNGEIQDRYGPLPEPVERLFEVMQVRILAKSLRLTSLELKDQAVALAFDPKRPLPEEGIRLLMDRYRGRFKLLSPLSFELQLTHADWSQQAPELTAALQILGTCGTKKSGAAVTA
ncbi:transcription-repair coupling factor [Candidatus Nitrospira bockiana]